MFRRREFVSRTVRLMDFMDESAIAIIPTAPIQRRNADVNFAFRPDSNFFYLTGFREAESVAVLMPGAVAANTCSFVVNAHPPRNVGKDSAPASKARFETTARMMPFRTRISTQSCGGLLESWQKIFYAKGVDSEFDAGVMSWVKSLRSRLKHARFSIIAVDRILYEMRLLQECGRGQGIRRAVDISTSGHLRAMSSCRPGLREGDLEGEFLYECMRQGARHTAYPTIVASGNNASIYHYIANKGVLKSGDMVLMDAGVEHSHYARDITRTFPVNGRFSERQRLEYELVLDPTRARNRLRRAGQKFR